MKRSLLLIIVLFLSMSSFAQMEHMKFMGIPLNGTISSFQKKLAAKGVKFDPETSKGIKGPCRIFNGTFSGEKAQIFVYYNDKTKIVYRAKAVILYQKREQGERGFEEFKYMLKSKYSNGDDFDGEQDGFPSFLFQVYDKKLSNIIGSVGMYCSKPDYSFLGEMLLHVDYTDNANEKSNIRTNMDDL